MLRLPDAAELDAQARPSAKCMAKDERAVRSALIRQAAEALADTRRHHAFAGLQVRKRNEDDNNAAN